MPKNTGDKKQKEVKMSITKEEHQNAEKFRDFLLEMIQDFINIAGGVEKVPYYTGFLYVCKEIIEEGWRQYSELLPDPEAEKLKEQNQKIFNGVDLG